MAGVLAGDAAVYETVPAPYSPSWVDRLTDWVRRLPVPYWVVYLIPALLLFVATTIVKWEDGSYAAAYAAGNVEGLYKLGPIYIYPFHAIPELVTFYALALMHYLDDVAGRAFEIYRPAMKVEEEHTRELRYKLTNMPALPTLLASLAGVIFAIGVLVVIWFAAPGFADRLLLFTSVPATILEAGVFVLLWWNWGALIYHTIRQLRLVNHIYVDDTEIDIFNLSPLYSFSWLTARTAIGLVLATYAFILTAPGLMDNPVTLGIMVFNFIFAVVAFAWPLLGIHRLLDQAKSEKMAASSQTFEVLVAELHRRANQGEFDSLVEMKDGLEALVHERDVIDKVYTWPWKRETVSGLTTALLLPIILWAITRVLDAVI